MTGNYIYTSAYLKVIQDMVTDLTNGELTADMVQNVLITADGTVFEVLYLDREGRKICLDENVNDWYSPTYIYRVTRVDALTTW